MKKKQKQWVQSIPVFYFFLVSFYICLEWNATDTSKSTEILAQNAMGLPHWSFQGAVSTVKSLI